MQWRAIHTQGQGVNGKRIVVNGRFATFELIFLSEEDFSCIKSVHQSLLAAEADQLIVHVWGDLWMITEPTKPTLQLSAAEKSERHLINLIKLTGCLKMLMPLLISFNY